ncbi:MAG TPA: CBS domain-containing protein, partial [Armatimonadota bacterium]|nr:CBS domain-containing protein [Armatimonadota bacterium]
YLRHLSPWSEVGVWTPSLLRNLLAANVLMAVFNLLPAFPMDGGRVLRAMLAQRMPYARATRLAATIGQGLAVLLGLFGLFGNVLLLYVALFVYMGAQSEAAAVQLQEDLKGLTVGDVAIPLTESITPGESLGAVLERFRTGFWGELPVVEEGDLRGVLTHPLLLAAALEYPADTPVARLLGPVCPAVSAQDPLESLVMQFRSGQCWALAVMRDGRLAGIVTAEGVGRFLMARSSLRSEDR